MKYDLLRTISLMKHSNAKLSNLLDYIQLMYKTDCPNILIIAKKPRLIKMKKILKPSMYVPLQQNHFSVNDSYRNQKIRKDLIRFVN